MTEQRPTSTQPDTRLCAGTFPVRLKSLRERQKMDRKTLAELIGLSKNVIGQYESGEKEPSVRTLIALADYFQVSVDYLLGREE